MFEGTIGGIFFIVCVILLAIATGFNTGYLHSSAVPTGHMVWQQERIGNSLQPGPADLSVFRDEKGKRFVKVSVNGKIERRYLPEPAFAD